MAVKKKWENIFPAICIPLNNDYSINEDEFKSYLKWFTKFDGVEGIVTNGHTGEITSLRPEERDLVTKIASDVCGDKKTIISGVSAEGTLIAIEQAQSAQENGADGILLMPVHNWLRFGVRQEAVIKFFKDIASSIDIGIIIHLYPSNTKAFYPVETIIELAKINNVKALKIGTRNMALYERDVRLLKKDVPKLSILTCHDEYLVSSMISGVDGALIGFGCCIPELITSVWSAIKEENLSLIKRLQDKIFPISQAVYGIGEPSGDAHARMKDVLRQRGLFSSALMRLPVLPLTEAEKQDITKALKASELIE